MSSQLCHAESAVEIGERAPDSEERERDAGNAQCTSPLLSLPRPHSQCAPSFLRPAACGQSNSLAVCCFEQRQGNRAVQFTGARPWEPASLGDAYHDLGELHR